MAAMHPLPAAVIARGRQILKELEGGRALGDSSQLSLFAPPPVPVPVPDRPQRDVASEICADLAAIDVDRTTPLEALALLASLRARLG